MINKILLFENLTVSLNNAALLAAKLEAELLGLFVEDINLLRLSSLPFAYETETHSAITRPLHAESLLRRFRRMASQMEERLSHVAQQLNVPWSFQVSRGILWIELVEAAKNCDLIVVSQKGQFSNFLSFFEDPLFRLLEEAQKPILFFSTEKQLSPPFGLLIDPSKDFVSILNLAVGISKKFSAALTLFLLNKPLDEVQRHRIETLTKDIGRLSVIQGVGEEPTAIASLIDEEKIGLLFFSLKSLSLEKEKLKILLRLLDCPVLLSP
ncbi:universal stress protein [Methylacidiphilum caldifontis]|uniref:Universal stress protein UspA n=1 Tax=Methylacidiphilum caldifontis TaxID=2795386 RepID=A0A4Y8PAH1_9BACT|nr:universal stress protein [Methylacidiphilum caldifontis]QSR89597.1 universal stress protein [Methylacidiphilum caldifontis]TFE67576.1 universal stress protein UspA [Methylacidiphilum caldifontis]